MDGNRNRLFAFFGKNVMRTVNASKFVSGTLQHCFDCGESFLASHGNSILLAIPLSIVGNVFLLAVVCQGPLRPRLCRQLRHDERRAIGALAEGIRLRGKLADKPLARAVEGHPRPEYGLGRGKVDVVGPQVIAAALEGIGQFRVAPDRLPDRSRRGAFPSRYEMLAMWQQAVETCPSSTSACRSPHRRLRTAERKFVRCSASGYSGRRPSGMSLIFRPWRSKSVPPAASPA